MKSYFSACEDGQYGPNCQSECGRCLGGVACDVTIGACSAGCEAGLQAPLCQDGG